MPQNWNLTYMYAQDFPHSCHLRNQLSNQYWKSTTWVIYHGIAQWTKNGKYSPFECTYLSTYFVQVSGEIQWLQKLCLVSQSIQLISVDFPFFSGFLHTVLYSVHSHRYVPIHIKDCSLFIKESVLLGSQKAFLVFGYIEKYCWVST